MVTKSEINMILFDDFKTSTSSVFCLEENIICVEPFPTSILKKEAISEVYDSVAPLKGNNKVKWLMLTAEYGDIDKSAVNMDTRQYHFNNSEAIAVVTSSLSARLLAKFYFSVRKYPVPLKLFKNKLEAVAWLKSI